MFIKNFFVKLAILIIKGLQAIGRLLAKFFDWIGKGLAFVSNLVVRFVILPLYKILHYFKKKVLNIYSPAKNRVFVFFTKKYIPHVLIVFLVMMVVAGNINAQEIRQENFGEETVVFSLFNDNTAYELVEEKALSFPQEEKALGYFDQDSQMENRPIAGGSTLTEEQLAEELAVLAESGSSIVKSNVSDSGYPTSTRTKTVAHTVSSGETLSTIAQQYDLSMNTILWANNLTANSLIKPGMTLTILPVTGVSHTVKKGDTLAAIARKYGVDQEKVREYNKMNENDTLVLDEVLIVPGGVQPQIVIPKTTTTTVARSTVSTLFGEAGQDKISTVVKGKSTGKGKMLWPTTWRVITQYYNFRHHGLDIDGDYNSPIYAAEAGVVETAGWSDRGYGNHYIVNHGNGVKTLYAHLSKLYAKKGQQVARGEILGMMGTTGRSTGTHLHFEVRINGALLNPLDYIK